MCFKKWELNEIQQIGLYYYGACIGDSYVYYVSGFTEELYLDLFKLSNRMRNKSISIELDGIVDNQTLFKSFSFHNVVRLNHINRFTIGPFMRDIERIMYLHNYTLLQNDSFSNPDYFNVFRYNFKPEFDSFDETGSLTLLFSN